MAKKLYLYKAIPSLFTISAFVFGFNAIIIAIHGKIAVAIFYIFIASLLDLFDGRIARLLGSSSKFGAELDSLSDFVCFGVATSIIILFYTDSMSKMLYVSVIFFSVAALIRLARFNLDTDNPSNYKGFFVGMPTPAGFFTAILPIALDFAYDIKISVIVYAIYLVVLSFLMISTLPTPSSKCVEISRKHFPITIGLLALLLVYGILYPWETISFLAILYIISIVFSYFITRKLKKYQQNHVSD